MDLPDNGEDLDLTLRHVTRQFPEHLARALLSPGTAVTSARWSDTQITARQRRLDRALEVVVGVERRLEHTEWQLESAMTVVAARDKRQRGLREAILALLRPEDVMQSSVYQMGKQEGKQEGELTVLARVYEWRLERPLTEGERAALAQRLEKLGVDRLMDVPKKLSGDALADWLGDPAAN